MIGMYDRILGAFLGNAVGDAMGAPTKRLKIILPFLYTTLC